MNDAYQTYLETTKTTDINWGLAVAAVILLIILL
jgi:hypothetical protein